MSDIHSVWRKSAVFNKPYYIFWFKI